MVQRLPDDVVHRILIHLSSSESHSSIATAVGVADETVYRIERNVFRILLPQSNWVVRVKCYHIKKILVMYNII
jgi:hypothetical protein